jgi:CO/xanthine dehydrogenase FAD-binding subunit
VDLNTIEGVVAPGRLEEMPAARVGDAFLAGGTWLFSEPQVGLRRLIDLARLGWDTVEVTAAGLRIGAMCTIARLAAFEAPADWVAGPLIVHCCRALLGSFKIWNMATVGGNVCMALPAGPMTSLCAALDGTCVIVTPGGGERLVPVEDFVLGPQETALRAGEVLRRIELPGAALRRRFASRRISLSPEGRSGVLLIGTRGAADFALTVTAATRRPVRLRFAAMPGVATVLDRVRAEIPEALYYDDVHGAPAWRRHMTAVLAAEIVAELSA